MARNLLSRDQVMEIVRLRRRYKWGSHRIALMMCLPIWQVKNVIQGASYVCWTGGPLKLRDSEASRWRGGRKSFRQTIVEG